MVNKMHFWWALWFLYGRHNCHVASCPFCWSLGASSWAFDKFVLGGGPSEVKKFWATVSPRPGMEAKTNWRECFLHGDGFWKKLARSFQALFAGTWLYEDMEGRPDPRDCAILYVNRGD